MVKRPLKDKRPIGPFLQGEDSSDSSTQLDGELELDDESAIVQQAENWYKNISKEGTKRKMMVSYIYGITDDSVTRDDAKDIVDRSGL